MDVAYKISESEIVRATRAFVRSDRETLEALKRPTEARFDSALVRRLLGHTLEGDWRKPEKSDGWLAPRIHSVLRFPRRIAAERGAWFWLATDVFRPYLEWRWPLSESQDTKDKWWRYNGGLLRNGISRLWWGAEMLRDGPDYSLVPSAFRTVRTYMFVSELRYSRYREAARAFTRVAAGLEGTPGLDDAEVQQLSILFNTYLRLDVLESHGPDVPPSPREWDAEWADRVPTWLELVSEDPQALIGPDGGYSVAEKEEAIVDWLRDLVPEARSRAEVRKAAKKLGNSSEEEREEAAA